HPADKTEGRSTGSHGEARFLDRHDAADFDPGSCHRCDCVGFLGFASSPATGKPLSLCIQARYSSDMDELVYAPCGIDCARLADLNRRSDARGLNHLAGHGVLLLSTATLLYFSLGSWWAVPATLLHGVVLIALFAPLHESIHRTAFRRRWLNEGVAWLCG